MNDSEEYKRVDKTRSMSFVSTGSSEDYSGREELKIKDLMMKIGVLRNGILDERNKNAELEKELIKLKSSSKEMEILMDKKENIIVTLSKEKYELQSKLDIEKSKSESGSSGNQFTNLISGIFQKRDSNAGLNDGEIKKLQNENKDLQLENHILKTKIEDQSLDFEKCKIEYQNLLNLQVSKIKKTENILNEKNKTIDELNKKLEIFFDNFKKFDVEKTKYESQIAESEKENKMREEKIVELLLKLEDKENIILTYKDNLRRHEVESAELARKLAELKNAIIEANIVIQTFRGEKVGSVFNSILEITFGRTDDDEYVMILKEDGENIYINVEDVEYLKSSEKFMDMLDVCYQVSYFIIIRKTGNLTNSHFLSSLSMSPKYNKLTKTIYKNQLKVIIIYITKTNKFERPLNNLKTYNLSLTNNNSSNKFDFMLYKLII
jgi:chromosome segregation ATPase